MIREATLEDVPRLVAMGRRFLAETPYGEVLTESVERLTRLAEGLIANDTGIVFVFEVGDRPVGMLGAVVVEHPLSGQRMATELFWWVEPEYRRGGAGLLLMERAEAWATAAGAEALQMVAPNAQVARVYAARGYTLREQVFQRSL